MLEIEEDERISWNEVLERSAMKKHRDSKNSMNYERTDEDCAERNLIRALL